MMDLSKTLEYYYKLIHDALLAKIEGNVRYVLGKSLSLCLLKAKNQPPLPHRAVGISFLKSFIKILSVVSW